MSSDSEKVRSIINEILKEHSAVKPLDAKINRCFDTAYIKRQGKSDDIILAAVEHYFFARKAVAVGGRPVWALMVAGTIAYDALKVSPETRYLMIKANEILGDDHPGVSPASPLSVKWGVQGANDGMSDFVSRATDKAMEEIKKKTDFF